MKFAEVIKDIPGDTHVTIMFDTDNFVYDSDYAIKFQLSSVFNQYDVIEMKTVINTSTNRVENIMIIITAQNQ